MSAAARPSGTAAVSPSAWWPAALALFAVGWGANQFVSLLPVYRRILGLGDPQLTAVFGVYALGLVPGLLLGGPASDRYGRRPFVLSFSGFSILASGVLVAGAYWGVLGLYAGRLLAGVVSGVVFAAGSAWVKELSVGAAEGAGARRAAVSLSAGFGAGPLAAGALAQWAPAPEVLPYLVHIALAAAALVLLIRVPETVGGGGAGEGLLARLRVPSAAAPRFRWVVMPMAPWVFGSATIAFTVLPARAAAHLLGGLTVAFAGFVAALGLLAGIAVQPLARRLDRAGDARGALAGLATVALGCGVGAGAAAAQSPALVLVAAVVLGAGYGLCLVSGLREVERLAGPNDLAGLVAVYYCLAYCGLALPYLIALVAPVVGYPGALLATAALAVSTLALVAARDRHDRPPEGLPQGDGFPASEHPNPTRPPAERRGASG